MLRSSSATMLTCLVLALFSAGCGGGPPPGKIATATQSNFRTVVVDSKRPVLVEFWSHSCQPCKVLEPHLEKLAEDHPELLVVKVNSDENEGLRDDLGVQLLPAMFVYQDGEIKRRKIGFDKPDELAELVSDYITSK